MYVVRNQIFWAFNRHSTVLKASVARFARIKNKFRISMRKNFQASSKEKSSVPGQICILTWLTTSEIEWNWLKKIERCWHFQFSFLSSVKNGLQSSPRWNCLEILSISIFLFLSSWLRRFSKKYAPGIRLMFWIISWVKI